MPANNRSITNERRQKLWTLLTRGMKGYEIAKELKVDPSTISRDIQYLTLQSQKFLTDLAKQTLPLLYEKSLDGIQEVIKEAWSIYNQSDNDMHKLMALKIVKEANADTFHLLAEGPSILYVQTLEEKLTQIEELQHQSQIQQQSKVLGHQISG
jgi:IS30 family transposase